MKKFAALTIAAFAAVASTNAMAFFDSKNKWEEPECWYNPYDCNPYDEWDPRYWMEEMESMFNDDDDYFGGPFGGYGMPFGGGGPMMPYGGAPTMPYGPRPMMPYGAPVPPAPAAPQAAPQAPGYAPRAPYPMPYGMPPMPYRGAPAPAPAPAK